MSAQSFQEIKLLVNGQTHTFQVGRDFDPSDSLAHVLKTKLGFTGLKVACDEGACGACTVLMDGQAELSCMTLAVEAEGREIVTIEGLAADDPVIRAFAEQSEPGYGTAMQCGYCTPGFIMSTKALLNENPNPDLVQIKDSLSGHICRCGCYPAVAQAALRASRQKEEAEEGK